MALKIPGWPLGTMSRVWAFLQEPSQSLEADFAAIAGSPTEDLCDSYSGLILSDTVFYG